LTTRSRHRAIYQGRVLSERSARRGFGTASAVKLASFGLKVETVPRRTRYWRIGRDRSSPSDDAAHHQGVSA
jgi:hypothetical protein